MKGNTIWAIAFMVAAGTAGVVALAAVGDNQAEILLPLLIGFLAPTVTGLVGMSKTEDATKRLDSIDGRLNGDLDARIEAAVERAVSRWTAPPKH
jgi:TctA family transporter